jgi:hypothetical protein
MKNKGKGVKSQVKVRAFHKDRLDGEMLHMMLLSAFYGLECAFHAIWPPSAISAIS